MTTIDTYGHVKIKVQSKDFAFSHSFTLAPVSEGILGWDFLVSNRLDIRWVKDRCCLMKGNKVKARLKIKPASRQHLSLAPVSAQNGITAPAQPLPSDNVPSTYKQMLEKYPNVTKLNYSKAEPAHKVIHYIDTQDYPPAMPKSDV